jgi:O-antigen ligase
MTNRASAQPASHTQGESHAGQARLAAAGGLLLAALLAGGANGSFNHLVVQLAALPLFYLLLRAGDLHLTLAAKAALVALAVAALQLVPLPPVVWQSFPGGGQAATIYDAVGIPTGWRPLALDPGAAAMALSCLFAPLALYVGVTSLDQHSIRRLLGIIAIFAALSAALGIFQKLTGGLTLYASEHRGTSTGLMINRNHHADIIIAGILLLPFAVPRLQSRQWRVPVSVVVCGMAIAVLATTSRMGMLMALPALVISLGMLWRLSWRWLAMLAALFGVVAALLPFLPAYAPIIGRFAGATADERLTIASNTLVAIRHFWPWGSGYGSFVPVYAAFEDLDLVHARYIVAAHDDYLQILLEGGLSGLLTLIGVLLMTAFSGWRLYQARVGPEGWAPWAVVILLLVHSAFDYPLRMAALAAVFATCLGAADAVQHKIAKPGDPA